MPFTEEEKREIRKKLQDPRRRAVMEQAVAQVIASDLDEGTRIGITYPERVQELEIANKKLKGQVVNLKGWLLEIRTRAHNEVAKTHSDWIGLAREMVEIEAEANFALEGKSKGQV